MDLTIYNINDSIEIFVLDIKDLSQKLREVLDRHFVNICEGASWTDISLVKKGLKKYLHGKRWENLELWSVAELFVHLTLNEQGYKQECLYRNLEEESIKKGFDWYYSTDEEEWIMESKSGSHTTEDMSHPNKIGEAYGDLKNKLAGKIKGKPNPWRNAYNHAKHWDVWTKPTIVSRIKRFSDDFAKGIYYDVKNFNLIPASTIFLDWSWVEYDKTELRQELERKLSCLDYKKIRAICITKQTLDTIYTYLDS